MNSSVTWLELGAVSERVSYVACPRMKPRLALTEPEVSFAVRDDVDATESADEYAPARDRHTQKHTDRSSANTIHDQGDTVHDLKLRVADQRKNGPRYVVTKPLMLVPVLMDGSPDWEHRVLGVSQDVNSKGIGLEYEASSELPTTAAVLLVESAAGVYHSAGLNVCHTRQIKAGRYRVGCEFGGFAEGILRPENLTPAFNPRSLNFTLGQPEEILRKWAALGILQPTFCDSVQLCPQCHSLPTFRQGCASCGSARLTYDRLIHHFACAHVGHVHDFEVGQELLCPKCRTRPLVVGTDFEYVQGPYRCLDCHWSNTEREQVAQCLSCGLRFPGHQAHESELRGYRAHRLDPLALLPAS